MKNTSFSLFLLITLFVPSCKKDTVTTLDFSQITVTDSYCLYIDAVDISDWAQDANWTTQESSLLNFLRTISVTDSVAGFVQLSGACPNPSAGKFALGINTEHACVMKLAVVNTEMHVIYYTCKAFTGGPILTAYDFTSLTAFRKNQNYRMYYGFYTAGDSLYYKGHGDFRIE